MIAADFSSEIHVLPRKWSRKEAHGWKHSSWAVVKKLIAFCIGAIGFPGRAAGIQCLHIGGCFPSCTRWGNSHRACGAESRARTAQIGICIGYSGNPAIEQPDAVLTRKKQQLKFWGNSPGFSEVSHCSTVKCDYAMYQNLDLVAYLFPCYCHFGSVI